MEINNGFYILHNHVIFIFDSYKCGNECQDTIYKYLDLTDEKIVSSPIKKGPIMLLTINNFSHLTYFRKLAGKIANEHNIRDIGIKISESLPINDTAPCEFNADE